MKSSLLPMISSKQGGGVGSSSPQNFESRNESHKKQNSMRNFQEKRAHLQINPQASYNVAGGFSAGENVVDKNLLKEPIGMTNS